MNREPYSSQLLRFVMLASVRSAALARFVLLFAVMYAAFGVASPFLPAFLSAHGLQPEQIGVVLAGATAARLISGPAAGRLADRLAALPVVLSACAALAAVAALCFLPAFGFLLLLLVGLSHAAALAPTTTIADALAVNAAVRARRGFEYGWVRGAGSVAFIVGSILSGQAIGAFGLNAIIWLQAGLLGAAACCAMTVPDLASRRTERADRAEPTPGIGVLLALPLFRRLVVIAALVLGSHAMHDTFAVIRWSAAGISPATASVLWSEAVAAEVIVFFLVGPALVDRLGPAGAMAAAAAAGTLRWIVMALTADVVALALVQPLHGLTFALLHLACMRLLARIVPAGLAATAQAIYGTLAVGAATAGLTLLSGFFYGRIEAHGFWVMAALCALALPLTWRMAADTTARTNRGS
jgi:MFS transporter, PPP family, 3-phenylpropionic acid transporter